MPMPTEGPQCTTIHDCSTTSEDFVLTLNVGRSARVVVLSLYSSQCNHTLYIDSNTLSDKFLMQYKCINVPPGHISLIIQKKTISVQLHKPEKK